MTDGRVLISTHNLSKAGALRDGFKKAGYETDLVTTNESLQDSEAVLLVLTSATVNETKFLLMQAQEELRVPVFAISEAETVSPAQASQFDEVFKRSASVVDVVLLGGRIIDRQRLRELTGIIGETDAILQMLERVVQIAPVTSTVLVTGESGTGKELVARGIHALSPRRHKPFIAVNVVALSETLLESELFGHEKGAFTGAIDARKGLFELSEGGTIFLDEIGDMPLATQTKLLRVLEQREFHRVGGERAIKVDVRIIAATNQDLRQLVSVGDFRRDLFFRLNVLNIELPPLRERQEDVPLLVESFVRDVSAYQDQEFPGISTEAMQILSKYSWPGNIRELKNLVESMVVLAPGRVIRPEDIPAEVRQGQGISLLPISVVKEKSDRETRALRPELEFVFRTLVELRVDMDDLRRDFELYQSGGEIQLDNAAVVGHMSAGTDGTEEIKALSYKPESRFDTPTLSESHSVIEEPGLVVFRLGMTIEDMEQQAIGAALREVGGNRRKAAELLGIGERTLYRKIAKYGVHA
jgi:DNA-binding NtrC family response regulator